MTNRLASLGFGASFGVLLGVLIGANLDGLGENPAPNNELQVTATVAEREVDALRSAGFDTIETIEDVLTLPTRFARIEATYAMVGKASSADVQAYLYEAGGIADADERKAILSVLILRLVELDARTALAMARAEPLSRDPGLEERVWSGWGRHDLDAALAAVAAEPDTARRYSAAQALYVAVGDPESEQARKIEGALGIRPARKTVIRYLTALADTSPLAAITYVNQMSSVALQVEYATQVAARLAATDPDGALQFADEFANAAVRQAYEQAVLNTVAANNPEQVLQDWLASGASDFEGPELYTAIKSIVSTDLDAAMAYYSQLRNVQLKRLLGSSIVTELVSRDVSLALAWAQENDPNGTMQLQVMVLQNYAQTDPLAAFALVDEMPAGQYRERARRDVFFQWVQRDPDAATEWVMSLDPEQSRSFLRHNPMIVYSDVELAIRLLPRVPADIAADWQVSIAAKLAENGEFERALSFARQYESSPNYEQLLVSTIEHAYSADPRRIEQYVREMPGGKTRDRVYASILQADARSDPEAALNRLSLIENEQVRASTASDLARHWHRVDAYSLNNWLAQQPAGTERDMAIAGVAWYWTEPTAEQQRLIDSVRTESARRSIVYGQIRRIMRNNPARAREMMQGADLSDAQRASLQVYLERIGG